MSNFEDMRNEAARLHGVIAGLRAELKAALNGRTMSCVCGGKAERERDEARALLAAKEKELTEAKKDRDGWKQDSLMWSKAWERELDGYYWPKTHRIDAAVLSTKKLVERMKAAEALLAKRDERLKSLAEWISRQEANEAALGLTRTENAALRAKVAEMEKVVEEAGKAIATFFHHWEHGGISRDNQFHQQTAYQLRIAANMISRLTAPSRPQEQTGNKESEYARCERCDEEHPVAPGAQRACPTCLGPRRFFNRPEPKAEACFRDATGWCSTHMRQSDGCGPVNTPPRVGPGEEL